jgi:hypothetical protein
MTEKSSQEVLCTYRKENYFLVISGSHWMVHFKVMGISYVHVRTLVMIQLGFSTIFIP